MKTTKLMYSVIIATLIITSIRSLWYLDIYVSSFLTDSLLVNMFGLMSPKSLYLLTLPITYFVTIGFLLINTFLMLNGINKKENVKQKLLFFNVLLCAINMSAIMELSKSISIISSGNVGVDIIFNYHLWLYVSSICFYTLSIISLYVFKEYRIK